MKGAESPSDRRGVVTGLLLQLVNRCEAATECAKCSGLPLTVIQTACKVAEKLKEKV